MRIWQHIAMLYSGDSFSGTIAAWRPISGQWGSLSSRKSRRLQRNCSFLALERLEERILLTFDPTGLEQEMLEHLNRMRTNPQGELDILFSSHPDPLQSPDPDIQAAIDFFQVDGATLEAQWASLSAVPPLTWDASLYAAAEAHNLEMIAADQQSHQLPGEDGLLTRILNAGYEWSSSITVGENIYAYSESVLHAHAGFAVDWGDNPPSGIQPGFGHRMNMMSAEFQEVGIRITPETDTATEVGPLVITQDFAADGTARNAYVLGTVFDDANDNQRYDSGEGLSNITLTFEDESGSSSTTSLTAGGYQIALPPGTYTATAAGTGLPVPIQIEGIQVAGQNGISGGTFQNFNVKVDFNAADIPTLSVEVDAPAVTEDAGSAATTGVVTRTGDLSQELVVALNTSDSNKITVPASVVIPAGSATSASFALDAVDDSQLTGEAIVTVQASATNHIPGSDTLTVTDVETVSMTAPTGTHDGVFPQFTWTSVGNAQRYDLWTDQIGGSSQIIREENVTGTAWTSDSPLPEGTFRAWVRAFNSNGDSTPWSAPIDFEIDLPTPGSTQIRAPLSYISDTTPTFEWDAATHATQHDLWVNQVGGTAQIIREPTLTGTQYTPTTALALGEYQAWVRGTNQGGESGDWSPQYVFTIVDDVPVPATPQFQTPAAFTTPAELKFRWLGDAYSEVFDLWVDQIGGTAQVIRETNLTGTMHDPVADLAVGDYRAWIRTFNSEGEASLWSNPIEFALIAEVPVPETPVLLTPTSRATPESLVFSWADNPYAERFDIWVDQVGGTTQIIRDSAVYGSSFQPAQPLAEGDYRVWLRAFNSENESSKWNAATDFTLIDDVPAPAAPQLLTPSTTTTADSLRFRWDADENTESVEIWVDQQGGTSRIIYEQKVLGTDWQPATALADGDYTVWLRAYNSEGESSPWTAAADFTVVADVAQPGPPELLTPAEIVTAQSLVFRWEPDPAAESYDLWVNQISGTSQIIRERTLYGQEWAATTTLPNGAYQAWLRATNSEGDVGPWGPEFTFAVADDVSPPAFPEVLAPMGTVTSSELQFRWQADPFAESYELWVNQVGGAAPVFRQSAIYTQSYDAFDLLSAGDYRVWVRAFNCEGESSVWSSPVDFQVVQTTPDTLLDDQGFALVPRDLVDDTGATNPKPMHLPLPQQPHTPTSMASGHAQAQSARRPETESAAVTKLRADSPATHRRPADDLRDSVLSNWPKWDWWDNQQPTEFSYQEQAVMREELRVQRQQTARPRTDNG